MPTDYISWLRGKIGSRKTLLAYATALVRDDAGRLLFHRRTDFSWWGLPGGLVEIGETFRACVIREVREETGLQVKVQRLVGLYASPQWDLRYPNGDEAQQFTVALECVVLLGESFILMVSSLPPVSFFHSTPHRNHVHRGIPP